MPGGPRSQGIVHDIAHDIVRRSRAAKVWRAWYDALMQRIAIVILTVLLAGAPATRADVSLSATIRSGDSFLSVRDGSVRGRLHLGDRRAVRERRTRRDEHQRRHQRRVIVVPDRRYVTERAAPPPPAEPVKTQLPTEIKAPPEPAAPPDPAGAARIVRARGVAARASDFQIGRRLPRGVPHVTLDPLRYDLPEPPDGQIYARVRGSVLLIEPVTRIIRGIDVQ